MLPVEPSGGGSSKRPESGFEGSLDAFDYCTSKQASSKWFGYLVELNPAYIVTASVAAFAVAFGLLILAERLERSVGRFVTF